MLICLYSVQAAGAIGGAASSIVRVPTEASLSTNVVHLCSHAHTRGGTYFHVQNGISSDKNNLHQVIKQRIQTGQFASAPEAVRVIVAKEGFRGLFAVFVTTYIVKNLSTVLFSRKMSSCFMPYFLELSRFLQGYGSFLLRDLPFDAIQFCIYEQLRIGYKLAVS